MRNIAKRLEPHSLTEYRAVSPTDYNGFPDKDQLRASLVAEQRALCCYCLNRIRAEIGSTKIEHWRSQARYPDLRLVYDNLLGACMGGEGRSRSEQHCDTYKGDKDLFRNPAIPIHNVQALIHFLSDGTITADNAAFDAELNSVLNLNHPFLVASRKQVLLGLQKTIETRGVFTRAKWEALRDEWNGQAHDRELHAFCSVVVYWIDKKLARL